MLVHSPPSPKKEYFILFEDIRNLANFVLNIWDFVCLKMYGKKCQKVTIMKYQELLFAKFGYKVVNFAKSFTKNETTIVP